MKRSDGEKEHIEVLGRCVQVQKSGKGGYWDKEERDWV
jgi:hypothetical protein